SAASLASEYMPAHLCVMRPTALTSVISVITSPAAPSEKLPRCIRCQSVAEPWSEAYWHIGDTTMRFGNVRPRMVIGENKALVMESPVRQMRNRLVSRRHEPVIVSSIVRLLVGRGPLFPLGVLDAEHALHAAGNAADHRAAGATDNTTDRPGRLLAGSGAFLRP